MHISSKNINASDLNGVYDYFDNVVNQMIRSEVDTVSFPNLSAFALDLGELVDKLDELIEDINPRVEKYLANKAEEERIRQEMEDLQNRLANIKKERQDLVGAQSDSDMDEPSDVFSYDASDMIGGTIGGAIGGPEPDVFSSPSVDIVFDTTIEDMIGDTSDLTDKAMFDDDAAAELENKEREREEAINQELEEDLYRTLSPLDAIGGGLEMHERGDDYSELTPEIGLYDQDDDDEGEDDEDDMFSFGYLPDGDYHYEDDEDDLLVPDLSTDDLFDNDEDEDDGDQSPFVDGEGYDSDYDADDDAAGDQGQSDGGFDDDWSDDFGGPNIDQLLSSASMTI